MTNNVLGDDNKQHQVSGYVQDMWHIYLAPLFNQVQLAQPKRSRCICNTQTRTTEFCKTILHVKKRSQVSPLPPRATKLSDEIVHIKGIIIYVLKTCCARI